jgi:hypothetical protein
VIGILVVADISNLSEVLVPPHQTYSHARGHPGRRTKSLIRSRVRHYRRSSGVNRLHTRRESIYLKSRPGKCFGLCTQSHCRNSAHHEQQNDFLHAEQILRKARLRWRRSLTFRSATVEPWKNRGTSLLRSVFSAGHRPRRDHISVALAIGLR